MGFCSPLTLLCLRDLGFEGTLASLCEEKSSCCTAIFRYFSENENSNNHHQQHNNDKMLVPIMSSNDDASNANLLSSFAPGLPDLVHAGSWPTNLRG